MIELIWVQDLISYRKLLPGTYKIFHFRYLWTKLSINALSVYHQIQGLTKTDKRHIKQKTKTTKSTFCGNIKKTCNETKNFPKR